MKIKKLIIGTFLVSMSLFSQKYAMAITVDGITFNEGAVLEIASVFEDRVAATGETLSGLGQITSIFASDGSTQTWGTGDNGRELTYTFNGFVLEAVIPGVLGSATLLFSGGFAEFYSDAANDFTVTSGDQVFDIASATGGSPFLSIVAATQAVCTAIEGCFSGVGTGITLISTVNTSTLSSVASGSGAAFFDVTGGNAAANFDLNGIPGGFDLTGNFSFDTVLSTDFDLSGSADFRTLAQAVPEPSSIALLGLGLLSFGASSLRRRRV